MSEQGELLCRGGFEVVGSIISLESSGISYKLCHYCLREVIDPNVLRWYGLVYHQECAMKLKCYEAKAAGVADSRRRGVRAPAVED